MQDLKITLVETEQFWEYKSANFNNYSRLLTGLETDLVLLPEMFQTGFTMNSEQNAEPFECSESIQWLMEKSAELGAAIYTSLIVKDGQNFHNRGVFVKPNGEVEYYDKRKLFTLAGEDKYYKEGNTEKIVNYKGWKFNLQICYDLRFPENVRNRINEDNAPAYDVILYVANWPERRIGHWSSLLPARAIENQCYVAAVNRIGKDENQLDYNGQSVIIDPNGNTLSAFSILHNQAHTFVIKQSYLTEIREKLPFLRDRTLEF
ncbi:MAG: nitrilase family protein [Bacteroidetes bacterium]|nr:MAG: nitrilase family protein [Bacteroidota bacterium]